MTDVPRPCDLRARIEAAVSQLRRLREEVRHGGASAIPPGERLRCVGAAIDARDAATGLAEALAMPQREFPPYP